MIPATNDKQLRQIFELLTTAWNEGDSYQYATLFTPDCDYVTQEGNYLKGRKAVAGYHQQLFGGSKKSIQLINEIENIRFISPDIALIFCSITRFSWQHDAPISKQTACNAIAVQQDGVWKIEALHYCAIAKPAMKIERATVPSLGAVLVA